MNPADELRQISDELDSPLTRALETVPSVTIADDFALRVMRRLPERRVMQETVPAPAGVGLRVALAAAMLLLVAMLALGFASRGAGHAAYVAVEYVLAAEFVMLTLWLSLRSQMSR